MDISWDEYTLFKFLNKVKDDFKGYLIALRLSANLFTKLLSADDLIQRITDEEYRREEMNKIKEKTVNVAQKVKTVRAIIKLKKLCEKCEYSEYIKRNCPALNAVCHDCEKKGHHKSVYRDLEEQK